MKSPSELQKIVEGHELRIAKLELLLESGKSAKIPKSSAKGSILDRILALKAEGFFDKPKPTREIIARLAQDGYVYPPSSLTDPLTRAVRNHQLGRVKQDDVWAYCKR